MGMLSVWYANFSSGLFSFNYLETENTYAPLNQEDLESSMDLPSSPPQHPKRAIKNKVLVIRIMSIEG